MIKDEQLDEVYRRLVAPAHSQGGTLESLRRSFALNRLTEGRELRSDFETRFPGRSLTIIDVGSGSGGVVAGLSGLRNSHVIGVDLIANTDLMQLRRQGVSVSQVVARAEALPFRDEMVDVFLCLDTVEHFADLRSAGGEMMRALKPRGEVMLTTPARLKILFRRDPHFGVPGLAFLPDRLQEAVVRKLHPEETYDVVHLFWTGWGLTRHFPGRDRTTYLVAIPWPGRPTNLWQLLLKLFRSILWDRIVISKKQGSAAHPQE